MFQGTKHIYASCMPSGVARGKGRLFQTIVYQQSKGAMVFSDSVDDRLRLSSFLAVDTQLAGPALEAEPMDKCGALGIQ